MALPSIGDPIIDSRDFDELIEDLEAELSTYGEGLYEVFLHEEEDEDTLHDRYGDDVTHIGALVTELSDLNDFRNELQDCCDWRYGEALIHQDARLEYAQQLSDDINGKSDMHWPFTHIDWKAAAEELFRHDYTSAMIDGHTYYVRMN